MCDVFSRYSTLYGANRTLVTVFDDRLGGDVNVEITDLTSVNSELLRGQAEFALFALIDHDRPRARTDDDDARLQILHLDRRRNAEEKQFALTEILDRHVFAVQFGRGETNQFVLPIDDRHRVRRGGLRNVLYLHFDVIRRAATARFDRFEIQRRLRRLQRVELLTEFQHVGLRVRHVSRA